MRSRPLSPPLSVLNRFGRLPNLFSKALGRPPKSLQRLFVGEQIDLIPVDDAVIAFPIDTLPGIREKYGVYS